MTNKSTEELENEFVDEIINYNGEVEPNAADGDTEQNGTNSSDQRKDNSLTSGDNKVENKEHEEPSEIEGQNKVSYQMESFAEALVKEYWDKLQDPSKTSKSAQSSASSKTTAAATSSKRTVAAASSKSSTVTAPKGKKRLSTSSPSAKQETKSQRSPKKAKTTKTIIKESLDDDDSECWEEEIVAVETVTRDEKTGELLG
ncbi:21295_t:CDS:2 [Entrophospora sp. SA101]|nr:2028_t:CDS:2 [Entrophospora sp. SA101]CAJ0747395.1 21295_t:CDS:2 [Entrophospora sp. SA101]CAJ0826103.1 9465_t:CDS:2 [Entrophospora sp. SA101]CAJ0843403.1 8966_t:CDS:2 [Entrophospora sp. SA101]CAJ0906792.1 18259_t:CDS:2 [Entrophospora sp. SA101]